MKKNFLVTGGAGYIGSHLCEILSIDKSNKITSLDDYSNGIVLVGAKGYGDNFGIGCIKAYSVLEIANLFKSEIEMIPERKGNRMSANVVCQKTINLGWREKHSVEEYIKNIKNKN